MQSDVEGAVVRFHSWLSYNSSSNSKGGAICTNGLLLWSADRWSFLPSSPSLFESALPTPNKQADCSSDGYK